MFDDNNCTNSCLVGILDPHDPEWNAIHSRLVECDAVMTPIVVVHGSWAPFLGEHSRLSQVGDPIEGQADSASQKDLTSTLRVVPVCSVN